MLSVSIVGFYIAAERGDCNRDQSLPVLHQELSEVLAGSSPRPCPALAGSRGRWSPPPHAAMRRARPSPSGRPRVAAALGARIAPDPRGCSAPRGPPARALPRCPRGSSRSFPLGIRWERHAAKHRVLPGRAAVLPAVLVAQLKRAGLKV